MSNPTAGKDSAVDVAAAMAHKFTTVSFPYTAKDVALYALGVGDKPNPASHVRRISVLLLWYYEKLIYFL